MPSYRSMSTRRLGQSVFIATSAYESVKAGYALSLAKTIEELTRQGIPRSYTILFNSCHVDDARNEMVRDFLENTDCTDLVFIDADMMWEPKMFLRLLAHDTDDIVAGAYRYKSNNEKFPVGKMLGGREGGKGKPSLLSVSYAPTGFMRIPRKVFETLSPDYATQGRLNHSRRFFERRYTDQTYDGGDVTFCRKWISAGGQVLIDPTLTLAHIGETMWTGNFLKYLEQPGKAELHTTEHNDPVPNYRPDDAEIDKSIVRAMEKFMASEKIGSEDFMELSDLWANKQFAATPMFLEAAWRMAKNLPADATILECGSGLSTILLAATGRKLITLEENAEWAERVDAILQKCGLDSRILVAPIKGEWYDVGDALDGVFADMLVVDGPRKGDGVDRKKVFNGAGVAKPDAAVIADDYHNLGVPGDWVEAGTDGRPFVVGRLGAADGAG